MGRYIFRRVLFMVLVLFVVSLLTFLIFVVLPPGDPARRAAGKSPSPEAIAEAREGLGLDQPLTVQYARFAKGLVPIPGWFLNEDVYFSYGTNIAVKDQIMERMPVTIALTVGGVFFLLVIGVPIGIISATKRGRWQDRSGTVFALIGISAPTFFVGYLAIWLFHYKVPIFPSTGIPPDMSVMGAVMSGRFWLPWLTLAFTSAAFYARVVRGNMLETLSEDFTRTAKAKGLSERTVVYKHALRAGLTPIVTMVGLDIGALLGGAIITEVVFNLPGVGKYAYESLAANDFPATMGVTVVAAFFIVVANLVVDVFYAVLDPRVRYE